MVVAAFVQLRQVEPEVDIDVVALCFDMRLVVFLSRTGNYDELVAKRAGRVAMSWILHFILS